MRGLRSLCPVAVLLQRHAVGLVHLGPLAPPPLEAVLHEVAVIRPGHGLARAGYVPDPRLRAELLLVAERARLLDEGRGVPDLPAGRRDVLLPVADVHRSPRAALRAETQSAGP